MSPHQTQHSNPRTDMMPGMDGGGRGIYSPLTRFASIATSLSFRNGLWILLGASSITYFLFQKKLLPKPISALVAKIFFYPTFPVTALLRLGNYWTPVDETLILGCAPFGIAGHPQALYKSGVRGVINMCAEYPGPKSDYAKLGIKQLRLPTVDHFEPSVESMREAVKFISDHKARGERVLVHCKAGHGRAASIALCWLIHEHPNKSAQELNGLLRSKRKVRPTLFKQHNVQSFYKLQQHSASSSSNGGSSGGGGVSAGGLSNNSNNNNNGGKSPRDLKE